MTSLTAAPPAPPAATPTVAGLLSRFGRPAGGAAPAWLTQARRAAADWATQRGFPTRKDEDWRYTPLGPLLGVPFERPEAAAGRWVSPAEIDRSSIDASIARMTFVNGFFAPHLSTLTGLPPGVTVTNLASTLAGGGVGLEPFFSPASGGHGHAFDAHQHRPGRGRRRHSASRPARSSTGSSSCSSIPTDDGTPVMSNPRSMIVAGPGSRLAVVETYAGNAGAATCTNAVTQVDRRPRSDSRALQDPRRTRHRVPSRAARRPPGPRQPVLVAVGGARLEDRPPRSTGPPRRRRRPHHHQRPVPARRRPATTTTRS